MSTRSSARSWTHCLHVLVAIGTSSMILATSTAAEGASAAAPAGSAAPDSAAAAPAGSAAVDAPSAPKASRRAVAPAAALGIGLAATAVPTLLAYGLTSKDSKAEDVALFVGVATGVVAGPALGLWSGGRGDLAKRGLIVRSIGTAICLGAMGVADATWNDGAQAPTATAALAVLGTVSGLATTVFVIHDLVITPSATAQGRPVSASFGFRPDGLVTLNVRF